MIIAKPSSLKCENCNYYAETEEVKYVHCCFREWGHGDWETAPCDEDEYEEVPDDYFL